MRPNYPVSWEARSLEECHNDLPPMVGRIQTLQMLNSKQADENSAVLADNKDAGYIYNTRPFLLP